MALFKRIPQLTPEELEALAKASENAASGMRGGPDSSPMREMDAERMERQAESLRRRAARARRARQ